MGFWQDSGEDAHRGGLAGAVRAQKAEDLPRLHLEADIIDRFQLPVALHQVLDFDHELQLLELSDF